MTAETTKQRDVHGTYSSYNLRKCRCDLCREANRRYMQSHRARNLYKEVPEHVHGTTNGYREYGCRCAPCRVACYRATAAAYSALADRLESEAS